MDQRNCQLVNKYGGKNFTRPRGVCIGANDEVIVLDRDNKEVVIFDKDMHFIRSFGQDNGEGKLNYPIGVAVGDGVIAVSEDGDHVVKKFTMQGKYLSKFGSRGNGEGQFVNPWGLAFNSKGLLFVVDRDNHRVQCFNDDNKFVKMFGSKGSGPGQFLAPPRYIAIDSHNQLYITDSGDKCTNMYSEEGQFIAKITCDFHPYAIGITPDDHIIIQNDDKSCLTVYSPSRELITQFGTEGDQRGQFSGIEGIAVTSNGTIIVAEWKNTRVQLITK